VIAPSATVSRATRAAAFVALTFYVCAAVRVHAQCVPAAPFTDSRVYYHLDQVGSVNLLTDHSGQVVRESRHYPYGSFVSGPAAAVPSPFGFSGHRTEDSHGFAYFEARYYVPELAVFASRDPAAQFQNPYSYAEGDPLGLRDPDGKKFLGLLIGWIASLFADNLLNPAPETTVDGTPTAEQEALQPAEMIEPSIPGARAGVTAASRIPRMADDAVAAAARSARALDKAKFAQPTFSQTFGSAGRFAGKTVDEVAESLQSGAMKPSDVPIQYIVRDGNTLILNTRSARALEQAGIPRSQWNAVNMTGDAAAELRLTGQLERNGLTSMGIPVVTPSGR
jgi:RHS repeat-associated protein